MKRWVYKRWAHTIELARFQRPKGFPDEYVADRYTVYVLAHDELSAYARALELLAQEKKK